MNEPLSAFYRRQLLDDCLPFWFPRAVDRQHGGFLHCFGRDGGLVDDDKSVWAQGRMSWMLLTLHAECEPRADWLEWAEAGLRFITDHCIDPDDGRLFFHVARDGTPLRKRRYAYSESFAAIAAAAHAGITGSDRSAALARQWFDHFVDWNFTPGKMPPKFTGARPSIGLAPRMIALVTAQEMEKWLGESEPTRYWIDRCIDEIGRLLFDRGRGLVWESVAPDGAVIDHFDGRLVNPGHAIEGAWFIMHEGERRQRPEWIDLGVAMLDATWDRGWDHEHGGLLYFVDGLGKPVQEYWHSMKFWWPHDEALIATAMAWRLTGDRRHRDRHEQVRKWAFGHFADPQHGEWFGYLHRDGTVSTGLKGNMWKSFFHHPRALWWCHREWDKAGDL